MALTVVHPFVSPVADEGDPDIVGPNEWNANHTVTGTVDVANGGTGQTTEAEAVGELTQALTADTLEYSADYFAFYDASADTGKKILAESLVRKKIFADTTLYVRTDGNDSNTGLVNDSGGALLTVQKAINKVLYEYDANGFTVVIHIGPGTFTNATGNRISTQILGGGEIPAATGYPGFLQIEGEDDIGSTIIEAADPFIGLDGSFTFIKNMRLEGTGAGSIGVFVFANAAITIGTGIIFGDFTSAHCYAVTGGMIFADFNYSIDGSAPRHLRSAGFSYIQQFNQITIMSPVTFSDAFAVAADTGVLLAGGTFVNPGDVTGKRFEGSGNAVINTFGGGLTYFPGTIAGTLASGAEYN